MPDRFIRIYELQQDLYTDNSPIVIEAGALLKDTQSENVVAQLKFHSVSGKTIKAVRIKLSAFDVSMEEIPGVDDYQYLDLHINNGNTFGSDKAILMPSKVTRSFSISSLTTFFADGTNWTLNSPDGLKPLPARRTLRQELNKEELVREYIAEINPKAKYVPQEYGRLWRCSCGSINSVGTCLSCRANKNSVFSAYDIPKLKANSKNRLQLLQEARIAEEKEKQHQEKIKQKRIMFCSAVCIVLTALIVILSVSFNTIKCKKVETLILEKQYEHAFDYVNSHRIFKRDKDRLLEIIIPEMQEARQVFYNDRPGGVLNVDGLVFYVKDSSYWHASYLYYLNEDREKIIIYESPKDYLSGEYFDFKYDSFMYANGYIIFEETVCRDEYDWEFFRVIKAVNIESKHVETLQRDSGYPDFSKLNDGRILVDTNPDIIFNPYTGKIETGFDLYTKKEESSLVYKNN